MRNRPLPRRSGWLAALVLACAGLAPTGPAAAQSGALALRDSIPIGSDGLCEAQMLPPRAGDALFDRRYAVICRDAAAPVGTLAVLEAAPPVESACTPAETGAAIIGLARFTRHTCSGDNGLARVSLQGAARGRNHVASGAAAYEDALRLGLATLASGRVIEGRVAIPLTGASDAGAFARAQAAALPAAAVLDEAYRRANAGNFAEAAEFFIASSDVLEGSGSLEARLNAALQHSNLGNYQQAATIFIEVQQRLGSDPVLTRMARNFEALDALNRDSAPEALLLLDTALPEAASDLAAVQGGTISPLLAERLAAEQDNAVTRASGELTTLERAALLDAQADYIRASALRTQGEDAAAQFSLESAQRQLLAVREGRIASLLWLRAQILADLAGIAERAGDEARAIALHGEGIALLETNHPASPALASARALLAGLHARAGRRDEALVLYRALVTDADSKPSAALRRLLAPYFALLAERPGETAVAELFEASQLLQRPGLAQTQAVLARELSGGSDEAGQLFRQSLNLTRAIEQQRLRLAELEAAAGLPDPPQPAMIAAQRAELEALSARQLEVQQGLAAYPRYRAISDTRVDLATLTATLAPGEAYYKLMLLDDAAYAVFARPEGARAWRIAADPEALAGMVAALRDSIAVEQGGQTITYPFEIALARRLQQALFGPVEAELGEVRHLVFEPDGEMLRLPVNLLVMDDASVERYRARAAAPGGDEYDFRGTRWLGREMQVTTAVSPAAFRDVRAAGVSDARTAYLGLGSNAPRPASWPADTAQRCYWAPSVWNNPIRVDELRTAQAQLERAGQAGTLLTGAAFSDSALAALGGLDDYRILHFATHGLVTPPDPDCPPRPALLTSFGEAGSDGLLSFAEIFDLRLDADLVILSACNTASVGGLVATREAGISSGGDFALDGLVRAFTGAGSRTVVASHWPVPDDYDATNRLVSGLFGAEPGLATGEALRRAQIALMDDADTSHPFYWSAFAVVGDGSIAVLR